MELTYNSVCEIVKEYLNTHNYSLCTEKNALYILKKFNGFIESKGVKDYRDVSEKYYYEYFEHLRDLTTLKDATLKCISIYLKRIFWILEEEEKILFNPLCNVKHPKAVRSIRDKVLSEEEINRMLSEFDLANPLDFRNRTILELFYGTGVRASELAGLELNDFYPEEKLIYVRNGKGKRERIIPVGEHVYRYILEYIKNARKKIVKRRKCKYLFVGNGVKALGYTYINYIIRKISKKSNNKTRVTAHVLRHTFATHLLKSGAGIRQIQLLLGHKCLSSTQVYINLNHEHLKEEYEKYHPLENELYFDVYGRESKVLNDELEIGQWLVKKKIIDIEKPE